MPDPAKIGVSRRTLAKGVAWTVPAAAVVAAAPAYAVSQVPPYALQGWLRVSRNCGWDSNTLIYDSAPGSGTGTDGDPFGLYIKNALPEATASGAVLTITIGNGTVTSVTTLSGNQDWTVTRSGNVITATYTGGWTWQSQMGTDPGAGSLWADGRLRLEITATRSCREVFNLSLRRCVNVDPDGPSYPRPQQNVCFSRSIQL
ncbi:hypothetical protein [Granulicoccus sp. GXG6511]|uniref:hypothetical protein n=1 Tax=Granulicoccus sp. GXG6511 TaxID=3381351 RepID=UPI003D7C9A36